MQNFLEGKFNELSSQRQNKRTFQNQMNQQSRKSKGHDFKYKSNKLQNDFLTDIKSLTETALSLHEARSTNRLISKLQDILDAIKKRRKIFIIADKLLGGWETVNEYLTDDVASDSDDDKRIRQAESQALAKKKARQVKLYYNKQYPKNTSSLSFP